MIRSLISFVLLVFVVAAPALSVAVDEEKLPDPAREQLARDLMKEVRCLVCQNQSIEDSNADLAKDLRVIIREQIGAGKSPDEVKAFLVARYGDWVLLKPPLRAGTIFLWGSPALFLIIVAVMLIMRSRQGSAQKGVSDLTAEEQERLKALLEKDETK
ncbi:cytochrome c-type biogenesis protein CcmH [Kordiimonas sediminis]|uniref:Cytochrome c-type biogenesis protein n=1 Tax=Kordiimonas sediminis TaxID=1735581 RepID=A0A919AMH8_9PROT|nr:cytochrome c-type biogenesis protein [Kordiimonas sediminis]GHF14375.1 cytochrome c-type biogenesis protein CcmH [Kordiimonas sediminis]